MRSVAIFILIIGLIIPCTSCGFPGCSFELVAVVPGAGRDGGGRIISPNQGLGEALCSSIVPFDGEFCSSSVSVLELSANASCSSGLIHSGTGMAVSDRGVGFPIITGGFSVLYGVR